MRLALRRSGGCCGAGNLTTASACRLILGHTSNAGVKALVDPHDATQRLVKGAKFRQGRPKQEPFRFIVGGLRTK